MALIEEVGQMRQQGMSDSEISQKLLEQGNSPLEISQAIEQSKIKSAISSEEANAMTQMASAEMQPSVMQQASETQQPESDALKTMEYQQEYPQEYQMQYPDQNYSQYQPYQPYSQLGIETISEIAEQILEEKISALRDKILQLNEFKTLSKKQIENFEERLKRIEKIIDKINDAIIRELGEYGDNISQIKDEMSMMQESFSKALNPLIDKAKEAEKQIYREANHNEKTARKKHPIHEYLRR